MRFIWFVWRSSLTRSFDATRATLQELNPELIFDFHRKTPQNHTLTMSAEAEKAPEVAKEEEKTSEELKATKRAAEVSKSVLRLPRPYCKNLDPSLYRRNFADLCPFCPLHIPHIISTVSSCRIIARKLGKTAIFLRQFI